MLLIKLIRIEAVKKTFGAKVTNILVWPQCTTESNIFHLKGSPISLLSKRDIPNHHLHLKYKGYNKSSNQIFVLIYIIHHIYLSQYTNPYTFGLVVINQKALDQKGLVPLIIPQLRGYGIGISARVVSQCCQHFIDSNIEMPILFLIYFYHEKYITAGHLYDHIPSFTPIIPGN